MPEESLKFLQEEARRLTDENRELHEELRDLSESVHALTNLYEALEHITPATNLCGLLEKIVDTTMAMLKASDGSLLLVDDQKNELVFAVVRGGMAGKLEGYRMPLEKGVAGWVATQRQPQVVLDVRRDPHFYSQIDELFGFQTRSLVCVPVYLDDGRVLGVIEIVNKTSDRDFRQTDLHLLLIAAHLAATAMRRAERYIQQAEARDARRAILLTLRPKG